MRLVFIVLSMLLAAGLAWAYPLDGDNYTGISRLEGYRLAQDGKARARRLPPGALLKTDQVKLRLRDKPGLVLPSADADFSMQVIQLLGKYKNRYGIAVLDLSDPEQPVYAEHNARQHFNPGSVGKIAVVTAIFHSLAKAYPHDIQARERILRETMVTADRFIQYDHHKVPFWYPQKAIVLHRKLQQGNQANLWTYLDYMMSASSNAAASMVIKNVMLLHYFGTLYPVSDQQANKFFRNTSRPKLARLLHASLMDGLRASGLDTNKFRQGKFFTREGKRSVSGTNSTATPRELMRYLLLLEQGKVIDPFSSREIKRLMYMTQKRIRYASHPALFKSAVYFKSGSMYSCQPEEGFKCGKYRGNKVNLLNSVAIIESPAGDKPRLHYMVVLTSNVLRKNSAVAHQTLAMRLHRLIEKRNLATTAAANH